MSEVADVSVIEATQNLSEKSEELIVETTSWLSTNAMDIAIASAAGLIIALVLLGIRAFGHRLLRGDDTGQWRTIFGRVLAKTGLFFIIMCSAELVAENASTPPGLLRAINFFFVIAAAFQAAIWARELILGFVEHRVGDASEHSTLNTAMGLIRVLVTITLFAIAIILILDNLGVNVTGLVAGLGIGGIAIGLAAQGIFSDLFAALAIIFDRPFRRGDTVTFDTTTGTVENIGLKTTRVRALGGEEVVVSNANLLDKQIQNWALLHRRRVIMHFGVIYQTPIDTLETIPNEVKRIIDDQELATFDRSHMFQFGDSSIDFETVFYVEGAGYADFMQTRQNIMLRLMRRFEELGVDFAYPTQMGFIAGLDGKPIDPREVPAHLAPAP